MGSKTQRKIGTRERAPGFQLPDSSGATHTLEELLKAAPVVLAFFKVSCPVCQFTFPFLERIHRSGGPLRFVGVSQDDAADTNKYMTRYGVSFLALLDEGREGYATSNAYGITHVPAVFVIETDGTVSQAWDGFSKPEMEQLGRRAGASPFQPGEYVPEWKAG